MFYRKRLSRFKIFRGLRAMLGSLAYSVGRARLVLRGPIYRRFKFLPMKELGLLGGVKNSIQLSSGGRLNIAGPNFVGERPARLIAESQVELESPDLELMELDSVAVVGGTNFILRDGVAFHPDLYDSLRDVSPAERFGFMTAFPDCGEVVFHFPESTREIPNGVSLLGQCTGNYAHWLTETLPKLLLVDTVESYREFPLLVDAWSPAVFIETVDIFNKYSRPIIKVNLWEQVDVKRLVELSPPAYVPPEYREFVKDGKLPLVESNLFPFSRHALDLLREQSLKLTVLREGSTRRRKLYLQRSVASTGNGRQITNIDDVEEVIRRHGFEFIETGKLGFIDQVKLFSEAVYIVSPVGAAMANTIFSPPGCRVIALAPYYERANYYYFSNLMGALKHDLFYVLGVQVGGVGHPLHRDYSVDAAALNTALDGCAVDD